MLPQSGFPDLSSAPLYDPAYEHDACGTGFIAHLSGVASHDIVRLALEAVVNLTHRGAVDADARTGDGAGLLIQTPARLLAREAARLTGTAHEPSTLAAGMVFLPHDAADQRGCRAALERALSTCGVALVTWRPVPVNPDVLGAKARQTMPAVFQAIVARPAGVSVAQFDRLLYRAARLSERSVLEAQIEGFHIASLSSRTLVYKGLFVARDLEQFYLDLTDEDCESALAVFHQRYSTNTFPTWALAQPFRRIAHNGEINTLQGNRNWMTAREPELGSEVWGAAIADLVPVVDPSGSDSKSLDNVLELLELSGRDIVHAIAMLVPEPWENMSTMSASLRAFYAYHATLVEPWDGPAALAFSDGRFAGATLDRNGLRPARYSVTADGLVVLASETGVLDLREREIVERGRLGPGQMLVVDVEQGLLWHNDEIKADLAARAPYAEWVEQGFRTLPEVSGASSAWSEDRPATLLQTQVAFGFSAEDQRLVLQPMAAEGKEPLWSMGDDAPLAILSSFPRPLAAFFRQRFAQVTNPPIDPLRETLVMSLDVFLGPRGNLLLESPEHAEVIHLPSPVLTTGQLQSLVDAGAPTLDATFVPTGSGSLEAALGALVVAAEQTVEAGATLLVISDAVVNAERQPIPMPLAAGAIHHRLIASGTRSQVSLVCDTGDIWDVHQAAVLIGYGVSAVHPWLAYATVAAAAGSRPFGDLTAAQVVARYKTSLETGLLKVMSKMGISALSSYAGGQLFEIIGLDAAVVSRSFPGTPARLGGLGLDGIAERVAARHATAFAETPQRLPDHGLVRFRRDGEFHAYTPTNVKALQLASNTADAGDYAEYVAVTQTHEPAAIRDLLTFKQRDPIALDDVEPVEAIRKRFIVTAMSLGALSPEAYRTLATAMNRIGARSNSGEGGEDPDWYHEPGPDVPHSRVKQVASGRFGVTAEYLSQATELEIKMAQGSKPGEGGQLPAHKVTDFIARLRHAVPGVSLISPPPHHDIYSIEDLAQLIYDLKMANPRARVGVKLVAEAGVGTVAAGVAKAHADYVLISGHSGGTGASPLSSIKHVGVPWELGLTEAQQTLVLNGLRGRVTLRTDGGLQTARDVVIAAMMGAEEFGFGTAALVSIGCDMARQCHLNTCPTGIATQRADLRAKFTGKPEQVIAYFTALATEVRELLAALGFARLDDLIGRVDLLEQVAAVTGSGATLDLSHILTLPGGEDAVRRCNVTTNAYFDDNLVTVDDSLRDTALPALEAMRPVEIHHAVRNSDRTIGGRLAGEIAYRHGAAGLPAGTLQLCLDGTAGQSFGAWCTNGLRLVLDGQANDYVGKGMSGGEIIIRETGSRASDGRPNVVIGNTVLYGATGGELYAAGQAGERFGVRNSGATAVVEGIGDHGCEYMTGGIVVVLGATGRNFGAGMTSGLAYVLDRDGALVSRHHPEFVELERVTDGADADSLRALVERHAVLTGSHQAAALLTRWESVAGDFWKVTPRVQEVAAARGAGAAARARRETADIAADGGDD